MSFLKNLFSTDTIKSSWDRYISDKPKSKELILVISNFFIRDNIKVEKFDNNYRIIDKLSNGYMTFQLDEGLVGTKVFEEYFNTDTWMTNKGMGIENWFVAAYPDAYIWYQKNFNKYKEEANKVYEANRIDNSIPHALYRFIIDTYLSQGYKLECAN